MISFLVFIRKWPGAIEITKGKKQNKRRDNVMTISLSIVVAVHNLENYISTCLDSALAAMKHEHDYEIILVDDSSCDASPKIMI